jgi:hypothetical protein
MDVNGVASVVNVYATITQEEINVSLGATGSTQWGLISGEITNQTDLVDYIAEQVGGKDEFTELLDTPASYSGESLKFTRVNLEETALEFQELSTVALSGDHADLSNIGVNTHAQIDSHIADLTIHFTESSISHLNIQDIGINSHVQIDAHIADLNNPHAVTKAQLGLPDVLNTAVEVGTADYQTLVWDNDNSKWIANSVLNVDFDNNYVGIGTNSPAGILEVSGTGAGSNFYLTETGGGTPGFFFSDPNKVWLFKIGGTNRDLMFYDNTLNKNRVRIAGNTGYVGIGEIVTPDTMLHILHAGTQQKWEYLSGINSTWTTGSDGVTTLATTGGSFVFPQGSTSKPAVAFGDGDTGFFEKSDGQIFVILEGVETFQFVDNVFTVSGQQGVRLTKEIPTSTAPNIIPRGNDANTGIGSAGADQLSLISGGVEGIRIIEDTSKLLIDIKGGVVHKGVSIATTTYTLLETDYQLEVSTNLLSDNCTITLPDAQRIAGRTIHITDVGNNANTNNIIIKDTGGSELFRINTDGDSIGIRANVGGTLWYRF